MTPGSSPRNLEEQALRAYRSADLASAEEAFRAARSAYAASNEPAKAAEMANSLCVVLVRRGRAEEALSVVEGTGPIFEAAGDHLNAARAVGNRASALEAAGRLDEAASAYEDAIDRFRALGARSEESDTWQALSRLRLRRGDPVSAATAAQAALDTNPSPGPLRRLVRSFVDRALRLLMR